MTRILATLVLVLASGTAVASSPVTILDGPPAQVKMEVYGSQHEIFVTLPTASSTYLPGKVVIELSSSKPSFFKVELAGNAMPDGRTRLRVFVDPSLESEYSLRIFDQGSEPWRSLYQGTLQAIPRVPDGT